MMNNTLHIEILNCKSNFLPFYTKTCTSCKILVTVFSIGSVLFMWTHLAVPASLLGCICYAEHELMYEWGSLCILNVMFAASCRASDFGIYSVCKSERACVREHVCIPREGMEDTH